MDTVHGGRLWDRWSWRRPLFCQSLSGKGNADVGAARCDWPDRGASLGISRRRSPFFMSHFLENENTEFVLDRWEPKKGYITMRFPAGPPR